MYSYPLQKHNMLFRKKWPDQSHVVGGKASAVISMGIILGTTLMSVVVAPVATAASVSTLMLVPCAFSAVSFFFVICTNMPTL